MTYEGIICADLHLRKEPPVCRLDSNWMETQRKALVQIFEAAIEKDCDIFCIGDIFHTPKQPEEVLNLINEAIISTGFTNIFYVQVGNHDIKYYDLNCTSIGVLLNCRGIQELKDTKEYKSVHTLVFPKEVPPQYKGGITAQELLDKNPDHTWIFTGDYHHSFVYEDKGRFVVNPGCMLRQNAGMKDYQPKIAYVNTETTLVEWLDIKDDPDMVTDEYLTEQKERNSRIDAFAEQVKGSREDVSMDFWENVNKKVNEAPEGVKKILEEIREEN